ncbi:MAG: AraC family transcriptional regulator [Lachnospiraceae bacterium]|nr:AraC family transcriptional regulator [Lachnospiraceae bacterium]
MVNNAEVLLHALDYIEDNIAGEITLQELADDCYVSVSSLQKTFKYVFHVSV